MTVTLDTNVLLSATLWDGSVAQKLLFSLIRQDIKRYGTADIILEYQEILERDFDFNAQDIDQATNKIRSFLTLVQPRVKVHIVLADPDDDKIIECAIESRSGYIITYDKHLLALKEHQGIRVIKPEEARTSSRRRDLLTRQNPSLGLSSTYQGDVLDIRAAFGWLGLN